MAGKFTTPGFADYFVGQRKHGVSSMQWHLTLKRWKRWWSKEDESPKTSLKKGRMGLKNVDRGTNKCLVEQKIEKR